MRIDKPTIMNNSQEEVTEKTDSTATAPGTAVNSQTEPAQLQKSPLPKTDSVEIKTNSFYNFDAPKLDSSKTNVASNDVPATMLPGVPFREKVELPKTLPNGTSVDSGVASGDLGFGKTNTGPNHMGIDLKGNEIRNQLNDALKLKEGAGAPSSSPTGATVNYTGLAGTPGTSAGDSAIASPRDPATYNAGFNRPGMGLISAEGEKKPDPKNPLGLPDYDQQKKQPDTSPASNLGKAIYDNTVGHLTGKWDDIFGNDPKKYTNPDAPEGTQSPTITQDMLERARLRAEANQRPSGEEGSTPIDGAVLSETDPRRLLISNPNPEDQSSVTPGTGGSILDAKGPDTVNPNDPEVGGGGEPITIDPNRPR